MRAARNRLCIYSACAAFNLILLLAPPAFADGISFTLSATSLTASSGGTATFTGSITNGSGVDLNATDFFFSFFAYDPTSVTPNQLLGTTTDFLIGNSTTTSLLDLFNVQLGAVSPGSIFSIEVQLGDANGDLSAIETVDVTVPSRSTGGGGGGVTTPEPASLLFLGAGLTALAAAQKRGTGKKNSRRE